MKCNVYDFDKTIYRKDSSVEFYKFCFKKKPSILKYVFIQLFYFILYIFSFIDKTKFKEHVFVFLKSFDDIDALVKEFWEKKKDNIRPWYIEHHQDNDIIISASPFFLLKPICDELGVNYLLASDVDPKTGKFNSPNCYGEGKVNRLKEAYQDVEIDEFYSDSKSDQPLADLSKDPYLIKKDKFYKWDEYKPSFMAKVKHRFFAKEFLAFLIVGFINTLNGVLFSYLYSLILGPIVAFVVGYLTSLTISYFLNSFLVFKSKLGFRKYIKFCISYIPNFVIQNGLVLVFYYGLHFHKLLVYTLAAIIAIPITFLVLSLVTFKKDKDDKNNESHDEINIPSFLFNVSALVIMTIAIDILVCSLEFLLRRPISPLYLPLSFVLAAVILFYFSGRKKPMTYLIEVCAALAIIVGSALIMGEFYDASYDGNAYHKLAVGLLKGGWNPIYETPNADVVNRILGTGFDGGPWVEGYCKGVWFFSASIYSISNNIETGKSYNLILLIAVLFAAYAVYRKRIKNVPVAILLSLITAFNPILISQLFTFYIDGALYAALALLVMYLLVWLLDKEIDRKYIFILIGAAMVFCGNIKFTGLLLGGCFCILNYAIYAVRTFLQNRKEMTTKEIIRTIMPSFIAFVAIALITVCWAGSNAYITNLFRYHTIGYPITGKDAVDIMTPNSPFNPGTDRFTSLFQSLFSVVDNFAYTSGNEITLKIPFTIQTNELAILRECCDIRLSGFGPLFSGVVILTTCVFIYECIVGKKNFENLLLLLNFILCLIFVVAIKESWWARYSPYAYIAVLLVLYTAIKDGKFTRPLIYIAILTAIILLVNDCFSFKIIEFNMEYSKLMKESLVAVKEAGSIQAYNQFFQGSYFNLLDQGVKVVIDASVLDNPSRNVVTPIGTYWVKM